MSPWCRNYAPLEIRAFLRHVGGDREGILTAVLCWDHGTPCHVGSYSTRFQKRSRHGVWQRADGNLPLAILSEGKLSGLETVPLQPRTSSKTNLDEYFISAEECLRLFPKKLKELYRVTCDPYTRASLSLCLVPTPPHSSHMCEFWYPVRPSGSKGHTETGTGLVSLTLSPPTLLKCPVNTDGRIRSPSFQGA